MTSAPWRMTAACMWSPRSDGPVGRRTPTDGPASRPGRRHPCAAPSP
jgi:hypothetical protein